MAHRALLDSLLFAGRFLRLQLRLSGAVPVVQHLRSKDDIKREAGDESVENELVVDLLESSEDARQGSDEIVEDLKGTKVSYAFISSLKVGTYRECAQLSGSTLAPNSINLGHLAGNTQSASTSLQIGHSLRIDEGLVEEKCVHASGNNSDERSGRGRLAGEIQDENTYGNILHGNEGRFAIGAEGELVAHAVREGDEQAGGFKGVGHEGDSGGRTRVDELQYLRDFDDGTGADDGDAQGLGDGQGSACSVLGETEVEQQRAVAGFADQRDDRVMDRFGDGLDDGLEVGLERIQNGFLNDVHDDLWGWMSRGTSGCGRC